MEINKIKNKRKFIRIALFFSALAFIALAVFISPLFEIRDITIVGNNIISDNEIISTAGIATGQNILSFGANSTARRLFSLPYLRDVNILREFPNTVVISVTERVPMANIRLSHSGTYLLIDDMGMVLSVRAVPTEPLLVVIGVDFPNFAIGEYLAVQDSAIFENILLLSRMFRQNDFFPDILDKSDPNDIVIKYERLDILFGNMYDAHRKVHSIAAIIEQFPEGNAGFIDIRDVNNPRFGPLR